MIKFRTMVKDAERDGAQWSRGEADERITKAGAFLRKTRLDELPQLFQVLTGKMSIIGPRPLIPQEETVHALRREAGAGERPGPRDR